MSNSTPRIGNRFVLNGCRQHHRKIAVVLQNSQHHQKRSEINFVSVAEGRDHGSLPPDFRSGGFNKSIPQRGS